MLVITNGSMDLTVTKGAYESLYKHQGFAVKGAGVHTPSPEITKTESSQAEMPEEAHEEEAMVTPTEADSGKSDIEDLAEDDAYEDEEEEEPKLSEIPLAEMTKAQLIAYAEELGIELDGDETKRALRVAIRKALN